MNRTALDVDDGEKVTLIDGAVGAYVDPDGYVEMPTHHRLYSTRVVVVSADEYLALAAKAKRRADDGECERVAWGLRLTLPISGPTWVMITEDESVARKHEDKPESVVVPLYALTPKPVAPKPAVNETLDATLARACAWFDATIPHSADDDVTKFREESREFLEKPSVEEAADALLCLWHWAHLSGADLHGAIRAKMAKNAARTWARRPDGAWHHVAPKPASASTVALDIETTCPKCHQPYAAHLGDETECVCPATNTTKSASDKKEADHAGDK